MKYQNVDELVVVLLVAPHWGAWIEIPRRASRSVARPSSHPTGVRGLKYDREQCEEPTADVAPHWGAWIEIGLRWFSAR